jgi:hypothetical protein
VTAFLAVKVVPIRGIASTVLGRWLNTSHQRAWVGAERDPSNAESWMPGTVTCPTVEPSYRPPTKITTHHRDEPRRCTISVVTCATRVLTVIRRPRCIPRSMPPEQPSRQGIDISEHFHVRRMALTPVRTHPERHRWPAPHRVAGRTQAPAFISLREINRVIGDTGECNPPRTGPSAGNRDNRLRMNHQGSTITQDRCLIHLS